MKSRSFTGIKFRIRIAVRAAGMAGRIQATQSVTVYKVLRQCRDENCIEPVEQFKILLLERRHTCSGISEIATSGITDCVVDPPIVFATALKPKQAP